MIASPGLQQNALVLLEYLLSVYDVETTCHLARKVSAKQVVSWYALSSGPIQELLRISQGAL